MLNDARTYQGVVEGLGQMQPSCICMPKEHNTMFGIDDLNYRMAATMITDSSVGDCQRGKDSKGQ